MKIKPIAMSIKILSIALILLLSLGARAQLAQDIRGYVADGDSKQPLVGATIIVTTKDFRSGAISNEEGLFKVADVPVGRVNVVISVVGYEDRTFSQIDLKSAKELVLDVQMQESFAKVETIVVSGRRPKEKPLNEMASVSARSFTVEETSRYAAAAFDPARMAQNFAGVTSGGDDLFNEIVVRGNSPKGVLWRLEGIEIANPNHFAAGGSQGGAISMLSSSTLGNSDFYTGAFPAEYGNATSGVFDLKFRKGNNEKRENSFMFGALGVELSTEGPFSKDYNGSYLINYRYSTLGLLEKTGLSPTGDLLPVYQDLSYNISLPTQTVGNFNVFGVLGHNVAEMYDDVDENDTTYKTRRGYDGFSEVGLVNTMGVKHIINLTSKSYLKSVVAYSYNNYTNYYETLEIDSIKNKTFRFDETEIKNLETSIRLSTLYNLKINNRNTVRAGAIVSKLDYDFESLFHDYRDNSTFVGFDDKNLSYQYQTYAQIKSRLTSNLTLNAGFHLTHLQATTSTSLEPRASLSYKASQKVKISLSAGKHSRSEHLALYLYNDLQDDGSSRRPNENLEISKAWHYVAALDYKLNQNLRLKVEGYYQHLFDIPISSKEGSTVSILNTSNYWDAIFNGDTIQFNNNGKGSNMGVDITLERFFSNEFYYLATLTLFSSKYQTLTGKTYNTQYNGNYQVNLLGGKEFILRNKNRRIGVNGKMVFYGGNRYTPIDLEQSIIKNEMTVDHSNPYSSQVSDYVRLDFGVSYKFNRAKTTHSIMLDVQNLTNRQNVAGYYYDDIEKEISSWSMTGFFPFFNYRIEF
jgi:hypothetical protein